MIDLKAIKEKAKSTHRPNLPINKFLLLKESWKLVARDWF